MLLRRLLFLITTIGVLLYGTEAIAAQRVILKYGILRESVSVRELSQFARTGALSPSLQSYLGAAKANPAEVRNSLTREVKVNQIALDRVLNSRPGELLLDEVAQSIHTPHQRADRQALRSAMVLSAAGDNRVSLIEVLENYPTDEVEVEGARLVQTYERLAALEGQVSRILGIFKLF